jgi:putative hydrolase of the HAD superfamily
MIIFDLDGTLYAFHGGSYETSGLRKCVHENAARYIADNLHVSEQKAADIFRALRDEYKQELSIGLEEKYGLDRYQYFNTVWNINPEPLITVPEHLRETLLALQEDATLLLLSDAPQVWIKNVLAYLNISDVFQGNILSGEGNVRKGFGNAFQNILSTYHIPAEACIAVGDQEETDIIPAKKAGMKTIYVNKEHASAHADFSIKEIKEIVDIMHNLKY